MKTLRANSRARTHPGARWRHGHDDPGAADSTRRGFAATRFADWKHDLRGNNDLLILTAPDAIRDIHLAYFLAGADIAATNTFSSTSIAQADYGLEGFVRELNSEGAKLVREAADEAQRRTAGRGSSPARSARQTAPHRSRPTSAIPAFARHHLTICAPPIARRRDGLIEGGADILLVETIFDTLNAKAVSLRNRGSLRRRRSSPADHDLGHDHGSVGPHVVGPDAAGVLAFGAARVAILDRSQLRARRAGDARPSRGDFARRRHARVRLSERRPAERIRPL